MTKLKRGFKTWCENAARGFRRELGLHAYSPLEPRNIANHLKILIWHPCDIVGLSKEHIERLTKSERDTWSALTIRQGVDSLIIVNSGHSIERQRNSLAHEIAHVVLRHEPAKMVLSSNDLMMMTDYDAAHEEEASTFGGALLVPREALLHQINDGKTLEEAASYFGVSFDLVRMRHQITGIGFQVSRRQRGTWIP